MTHIYDQAASTTAAKVEGSETTLSYGSATLDGYFVTDTVCLATEDSMCVENFKFFEITKDQGLSFDGILGLSPISDKNAGDSIVQSMYKNNMIDREKATFHLNMGGTNSTVTFGRTPDGILRGGTVSLDLVSKYDNWWTAKLRGNHYGGKSI